MDKEFIKFIISPKGKNDDRLIKEGDLIDLELVDILCSAPISSLNNAFAPIGSTSAGYSTTYSIELCCPKCGTIFIRNLSKSKLLNTLRFTKFLKNGQTPKDIDKAGKFLLCDKCFEIENKKKEPHKTEPIDSHKREQEEKLTQYIHSYINPNNSFNSKLSGKERENHIMNGFFDFTEYINSKIQSSVLSLSYSDFLKTPYWDGIRNYKLRRSGYKCELCASKELLNVHHKTYENHGLEHLRSVADKDLIVLCKNCHYKFHDKLSKEESVK